jgi:hypothetical protein
VQSATGLVRLNSSGILNNIIALANPISLIRLKPTYIAFPHGLKAVAIIKRTSNYLKAIPTYWHGMHFLHFSIGSPIKFTLICHGLQAVDTNTELLALAEIVCTHRKWFG